MDNLAPWKLFFFCSFCLQCWGFCSTAAEVKRKKEEEKKKEASLSNRQRVELFKKVTATSLSRSSRAVSRRAAPKSDGYFLLCSSSFGMKYVAESSSSSASSSWRSCRGFNKPLQMSWFEITTLWKPNTKDPPLTFFLPRERGGAAVKTGKNQCRQAQRLLSEAEQSFYLWLWPSCKWSK